MDELRVEGITIRLEDYDVLSDVSFCVRRGEVMAIVGPSGCGKSTLLRVIAGQLKADGGTVSLPKASAPPALMPQQDMLLEWFTVLDNTALPLRFAGASKKAARAAAAAHFAAFGLAGFERYYPCQLSGGMRQRAAMLRTLLSGAETLLLDEPFGALDAITRMQMQDFLRVNRAQLGTILLVTHDVEEAIYLAQRIIVLRGTPARVALEIEAPGEKTREWMLGAQCGEIKRKLLEALV